MIDQSLLLVTLVRDTNGEDGAFSIITNLLTGHFWQGAELEWRDNLPGISCIPGDWEPDFIEYLVQLQPHPKHGNLGALVGKPGMAYEIMNVPGRSAILMHIANWAGSEISGEKSDLLGCVGLGMNRADMVPPGYARAQEEITSSTVAVEQFYKEIGGNDFRLRVINNFPKAA